jgi:NADH-quinone oxidoreductase subunit H
VWILAVATIHTIDLNGGIDRTYLYAGIAVCLALIVVLFFVEEKQQSEAAEREEAAAFDALGSGYPVPPMPTSPGFGVVSRAGRADMDRERN